MPQVRRLRWDQSSFVVAGTERVGLVNNSYISGLIILSCRLAFLLSSGWQRLRKRREWWWLACCGSECCSGSCSLDPRVMTRCTFTPASLTCLLYTSGYKPSSDTSWKQENICKISNQVSLSLGGCLSGWCFARPPWLDIHSSRDASRLLPTHLQLAQLFNNFVRI